MLYTKNNVITFHVFSGPKLILSEFWKYFPNCGNISFNREQLSKITNTWNHIQKSENITIKAGAKFSPYFPCRFFLCISEGEINCEISFYPIVFTIWRLVFMQGELLACKWVFGYVEIFLTRYSIRVSEWIQWNEFFMEMVGAIFWNIAYFYVG